MKTDQWNSRRSVLLAIPRLAGTLLLLCLVPGCPGGIKTSPVSTALDKRIVEEATDLVETSLANLPSDDTITKRYGKFLSLRAMPAKRFGGYSSFDLACPASIQFRCICEFEKYPATVNVIVHKGEGPPTAEFDLSPSQYPVDNGTFSDSKPVVIENDLWFESEDGSRLHSILACVVKHPEFTSESQ